MTNILYILLAVTLVSLISLVGVIALSLKKKLLRRALFFLVSFATGTLMGVAFLDLLPEALEYERANIFLFPILGMLVFFVIEKFIYWHHHHTGEKEIHAYTRLNLIGDGVHNFIDGIVIAASFLHSVPLGIATTVAIILHEIPQEIGDFSILVYGGFSQMKALFFNFLTALTALIGALVGFYFLGVFENMLPYLLAFAAGNFIYIAGTDLLPELREERKASASFLQLVAVTLGILTIFSVTMLLK